MAKLLFLPTNKEVQVRGEENVLMVALRNRIPISTSCGGSGSCGTCRVFVTCGQPRNDVEQAMADDRRFKDDERLACQIEPADGMVVTVADD